jgi:hypothetical protein
MVSLSALARRSGGLLLRVILEMPVTAISGVSLEGAVQQCYRNLSAACTEEVTR